MEVVRVWWEPTKEAARDGYAGAFWPALLLGVGSSRDKRRVRYDNGDEEEVHIEHISPNDTLPVDFGQETTELQRGEFCEVHNGSKTDPCAWLGRVVKRVPRSRHYIVEYPFHDSKPEKIENSKIRRARIMEDGEWRLIKPGQDWEDGEVTSPVELELINEEELEDCLPKDPPPPSRARKTSGEGSKRARKGSRGRLAEDEMEEEDGSDDDEDDEEEDEEELAAKKLIKGRPSDPRPRKQARYEKEELGGAAAFPVPGQPIAPPPGMLSLFVTIEQTASAGGFCFLPVPASLNPPAGSFQVFFPLSAMPQLTPMELAIGGSIIQNPGVTARESQGVRQPAGGGRGRASSAGPKKPRSAWNFYVEKNKAQVAEEYPDKDGNEVIAILGARWKNVSASERAVYEREAEREQAASKASMGNLPMAPRTAEQLYSIEFIKALQATPGGPGRGVTDAVAKASAAAAWVSAEPSIKDKYEANAVADRHRYEREMMIWQMQQGQLIHPSVAKAGSSPASKHMDPIDPDDWDEVLDRGIDMKKVKRRLQDHGFTSNAYLLLMDAWRRDSPKIAEAMDCYKTHIHGIMRPNWTAFLTDLLGPAKVETLRKPPVERKKDQENQEI